MEKKRLEELGKLEDIIAEMNALAGRKEHELQTKMAEVHKQVNIVEADKAKMANERLVIFEQLDKL